VAYVSAVAVYIAMGVYRWRLDRQSINPQGLLSVAGSTLILGSCVNLIIWIAFFH